MSPRLCGQIAILVTIASAGCGTTRWTGTKRTATEQMLISDAIDRAVSRINLQPLARQRVFLDATYLKGTVDENYTVSVLRQHLMASGCVLLGKKEEADFIVEARAGAVGTTRHDVLYGIPATQLSVLEAVPGVPQQIPEISIVKKTYQQGVAKIALFAYHRESGTPLWQSGNAEIASNARDIWVLGIGPFQQGTIHDHTRFAGGALNPLKKNRDVDNRVWVAETLQFDSAEAIARRQQIKRFAEAPATTTVAPSPPASAPAGPPATVAPSVPQGKPPSATIRGVRVP